MDYIRFRGVPTEHLIQRGPYSRRGCTVEGAQQYFQFRGDPTVLSVQRGPYSTFALQYIQFRGGHTVLSVQRGPYSTVNLVQREHYNTFSLEKAIQFNQFGPYSSFRLEEAIQYSQFRGGPIALLIQSGLSVHLVQRGSYSNFSLEGASAQNPFIFDVDPDPGHVHIY